MVKTHPPYILFRYMDGGIFSIESDLKRDIMVYYTRPGRVILAEFGPSPHCFEEPRMLGFINRLADRGISQKNQVGRVEKLLRDYCKHRKINLIRIMNREGFLDDKMFDFMVKKVEEKHYEMLHEIQLDLESSRSEETKPD